MAELEKKPFHQHEHPAYPWVALFVSLFAILALAGWYYLANLDTLNAEIDSAMSSAFQTTKATTTVSPKAGTLPKATSPDQTTIDQSVTSIDKLLNSASSKDFSDTTLGDSTIGVGN